jgi:hypothetical protein
LKNSINEQHKKQLEEGKISLEKKLLEVENQLVESERQRQEFLKRHLAKVIPTVAVMEQLKASLAAPAKKKASLV